MLHVLIIVPIEVSPIKGQLSNDSIKLTLQIPPSMTTAKMELNIKVS